jgi:DNA-binding NarL/FixJ family response regulator
VAIFYQTKKFKRENAKWQRKLERVGFVDIERNHHHGTVLQDLAEFNIHFRDRAIEATQAYYSWADEMVHRGKFKIPRDRAGKFKAPGDKKVWRLHAQGLKNAEIAERLGMSRWSIENFVKAIRQYLENQ